MISMEETGPWETDWIVINCSEKAMGQTSLFTFSHALKTFTGDKVVKRLRLTHDKNPD